MEIIQEGPFTKVNWTQMGRTYHLQITRMDGDPLEAKLVSHKAVKNLKGASGIITSEVFNKALEIASMFGYHGNMPVSNMEYTR